MNIPSSTPIAQGSSSAASFSGASNVDAQTNIHGQVRSSSGVDTSHFVDPSQNSPNSSTASSAAHETSSWKYLLGLFPMVAYFVAAEFADLYVATAIAIGSVILQMIWQQTQDQHIPFALWIQLAVSVVMGGVGFFFQNPLLIKLIPTITSILIGGVLLLSECFGKNDFIKHIIKSAITLSKDSRAKLSLSYAVLFIGLGALNTIIACTVSNRTWLLFSLLGAPILATFFGASVFLRLRERERQAQYSSMANNSNTHIHDANAIA